MIFLTSIESILPIIFIIGLGYYLQTKGWFADSFGGNISKLIMNVALPASIFVSVLKYLTRDRLLSLSSGLIYTFSGFGFCYLLAFLLVKVLNVPAGRRGTFINTVVNANTIFIGLPLNITLFGDKALPYFLIYYITNTISTWTLGIYLMTSDSKSGKGQSSSFNWKKLLPPPPLIGFLVALGFLLLDIPVPSFATNALTYLGNIVTPLSLIYIGIILAKAGFASIRLDRDSLFALLGRFVLAPAAMYLLLTTAGQALPTLEFKTFVIQSATPALSVLPILATQGDGDVEYATNVVTLSTLLFVIVIPVILTILG